MSAAPHVRGFGVLASGSGSNLQAILEAERRGELGAPVRLVASDKPGARALERAASFGVPTQLLLPREHADRAAYDRALVAALQSAGCDWVVLAGYMRLVSRALLDAFPGRVINIHPSLLPAFPGLHAQRQALAHGVKIAGCTVHLVDEGTDTGPIVMQAAVPVLPGDSEDSLAARILVEEHRIFPAALRAAAEGRLELVELAGGRRTVVVRSPA